MFIAAAPPSVTCMVPGTMGGHQPLPITYRQSCAIVTPGSATTMPAAGSQARMLFMRERSRQTCSAFSAASP